MRTFLKILGLVFTFIAVYVGCSFIRVGIDLFTFIAFAIFVGLSILCFWGAKQIKKREAKSGFSQHQSKASTINSNKSIHITIEANKKEIADKSTEKSASTNSSIKPSVVIDKHKEVSSSQNIVFVNKKPIQVENNKPVINLI